MGRSLIDGSSLLREQVQAHAEAPLPERLRREENSGKEGGGFGKGARALFDLNRVPPQKE